MKAKAKVYDEDQQLQSKFFKETQKLLEAVEEKIGADQLDKYSTVIDQSNRSERSLLMLAHLSGISNAEIAQLAEVSDSKTRSLSAADRVAKMLEKVKESPEGKATLAEYRTLQQEPQNDAGRKHVPPPPLPTRDFSQQQATGNMNLRDDTIFNELMEKLTQPIR